MVGKKTYAKHLLPSTWLCAIDLLQILNGFGLSSSERTTKRVLLDHLCVWVRFHIMGWSICIYGEQLYRSYDHPNGKGPCHCHLNPNLQNLNPCKSLLFILSYSGPSRWVFEKQIGWIDSRLCLCAGRWISVPDWSCRWCGTNQSHKKWVGMLQVM